MNTTAVFVPEWIHNLPAALNFLLLLCKVLLHLHNSLLLIRGSEPVGQVWPGAPAGWVCGIYVEDAEEFF